MKSAKLKITLHSGRGLKYVKHFGIMKPYAKMWISGEGMEMESKHKTNIAKEGGSDPVWEYPISFGNVSMKKDYILFIEVKHDGTMHDRKIGEVQIPFADLLTGDALGDRVSYGLIISGEKHGHVILSHRLSDIEDEDGTKTSSSQVPVAPVKIKKGGKAKQAAQKIATKIAMGAAEATASIGITAAAAQLQLFGSNAQYGQGGQVGYDGQVGTDGQDGQVGTDGQDGQVGYDGQDGQVGYDGQEGEYEEDGDVGAETEM